jgi:apolipoprotein N-acyltransferase
MFVIFNFKKGKWTLFQIGWIFGFGYFISNLYWITNSLTFEEIFKPLIPVTLIIIPLFLGLFYGFGTLFCSFFKLKKNFSTILIFATIFSLIEFFRGFILGGFPWNIIAYSWSNYLNSLQILSLVGTYSFNLLSITIFLLPFIIFFNKNSKSKLLSLFFLLIILVSNHFFGGLLIRENKKVNNIDMDFTIKIISPKIGIKRFLNYEDPDKTIKELVNLSNPNSSEKTIFVFPEGILTSIYLEDLKNYKKIFSDNYSDNHTIILGMNSVEKVDGRLKIYNSLVVLDNNANLLGKYNKNKLVPFGEFLPFENFLSKLGLKKITLGYQSFSSGKKRSLITINNKNFIPLICYEIIYSGKIKTIGQNVNFIINISEDGWFGNSIGPDQHFAHSIFRAIEEGKNIIRSANNGISAFINPKGEVISKIKSTEKGVIEIKNFKQSDKTFFNVHGNKIFFYFILVYIILIFFLKKRKNR